MDQELRLPARIKARLPSLSPAFPVVLGYLPIGFAFGVLASSAGISTFNAILMSLVVFAGSAQLVSVSLISQGLNPFSIIAATTIINLRHLLMSASLSPYMQKWTGLQVAGFCYELTDETFGVHSLRFEQGDVDPHQALRINGICHLAWVLGTVLGVLAGGMIGDVYPFGLDYALPAMFIALLVMQIRGRQYLIVALIAATLSMLVWSFGLTQWNVILAAVFSAAIGAGVETWRNQRN